MVKQVKRVKQWDVIIHLCSNFNSGIGDLVKSVLKLGCESVITMRSHQNTFCIIILILLTYPLPYISI